MVQVQQRVLTLALLAVVAAPEAPARRFYADDPLWRDPAPMPVETARRRGINDYYDFFQNTFFEPDKELRKEGRIPRAGAVNTLGEVPDSAWYTNRHPLRPMTVEELVRGPGNSQAPAMDGPWTVLSGKHEGITPGLAIRDAKGRHYLLKFDPLEYPELSSAADVIGSKFFYAFGYNVPENYIVRFTASQFRLTEKSTLTDYRGRERRMNERDLRDVLAKVPRDAEGRYRCMASLYISGELIGPFRYYGVRRDDPNDVVRHEHRRDLRGLYVFAAWLNHTDSKSLNTLDAIVQENGARYIRHYLIDFGAILGSDSFTAKSPRAGNVYLFDFKPAAWQFLSLGLYAPAWQRFDYPDLPAVGRLQSAVFDPEEWKPNYPNPAFNLRLPDDTYWAAKKVMGFTDEQIRAMVRTGAFTDPGAVDYITRALIERRDRIGRAFFDDVLPLDDFRVTDGRLEFVDLAVKHNFAAPRRYTVQWSRFDNDRDTKTALPGETTFALPREFSTLTGYAAADIAADDARKTVTVYLRNRGGHIEVVGIDRTW